MAKTNNDGIPTWDDEFLQVSATEGRANQFPVCDDGEFTMFVKESELRPTSDKTGVNWFLSWLFPEGTSERDLMGNFGIRQWIKVDRSNFSRIEEAYKAIWDREWPSIENGDEQDGLDREEFADMIRNSVGRSALVTVEVAPHFLADTDPKMAEAKQNNVIALTSQVLAAEEDNDSEIFTVSEDDEESIGFGL